MGREGPQGSARPGQNLLTKKSLITRSNLGNRGTRDRKRAYWACAILLVGVTAGLATVIWKTTTTSPTSGLRTTDPDGDLDTGPYRPAPAMRGVAARIKTALADMPTAKAEVTDLSDTVSWIVADVPGGGAYALPSNAFGFKPPIASPEDFDQHASEIFKAVYGIARYQDTGQLVVVFGRIEDKSAGHKYNLNAATYTLPSSDAENIDWNTGKWRESRKAVRWSKFRDDLMPIFK